MEIIVRLVDRGVVICSSNLGRGKLRASVRCLIGLDRAVLVDLVGMRV